MKVMQTFGGATPLMYACQQSKENQVLDILTKQPKAVKDRDRTLKTPLHYCAENPNTRCSEIVLKFAPDLVNAQDENGYCTLHLAVIAGNKSLIKLLIANGADVNIYDNEGHSSVHWAIVSSEKEALEMIIRAGANPSTPDIHGGYPLHYAVQMCGSTSDYIKNREDTIRVVETLLNFEVDVNVKDKDGRQPILWAASAGSADAVIHLVSGGACVEAADKDGLTALHCAASRGHTTTLETLITLCGTNVDVIDGNGCSALFYSVTLGHADATEVLLELGAEPNRQDRKGRTPAHCGAAKGQLETLKILQKRGGNLWLRNVKGDIPLHEAVASGRKDLVLWLLSQNAESVNIANNDGRCPIHIAAMYNNTEMVKILLDAKSLVNPVMRTSKGVLMTPLNVALCKGHRSCGKYLQLHGGVPFSKVAKIEPASAFAFRVSPSSDIINNPTEINKDSLQLTKTKASMIKGETNNKKKIYRRRKKRRTFRTDFCDSDSDENIQNTKTKLPENRRNGQNENENEEVDEETDEDYEESKVKKIPLCTRKNDSLIKEKTTKTNSINIKPTETINDATVRETITENGVINPKAEPNALPRNKSLKESKNVNNLSPDDFPPLMQTVNQLDSVINEPETDINKTGNEYEAEGGLRAPNIAIEESRSNEQITDYLEEKEEINIDFKEINETLVKKEIEKEEVLEEENEKKASLQKHCKCEKGKKKSKEDSLKSKKPSQATGFKSSACEGSNQKSSKGGLKKDDKTSQLGPEKPSSSDDNKPKQSPCIKETKNTTSTPVDKKLDKAEKVDEKIQKLDESESKDKSTPSSLISRTDDGVLENEKFDKEPEKQPEKEGVAFLDKYKTEEKQTTACEVLPHVIEGEKVNEKIPVVESKEILKTSDEVSEKIPVVESKEILKTSDEVSETIPDVVSKEVPKTSDAALTMSISEIERTKESHELNISDTSQFTETVKPPEPQIVEEKILEEKNISEEKSNFATVILFEEPKHELDEIKENKLTNNTAGTAKVENGESVPVSAFTEISKLDNKLSEGGTLTTDAEFLQDDMQTGQTKTSKNEILSAKEHKTSKILTEETSQEYSISPETAKTHSDDEDILKEIVEESPKPRKKVSESSKYNLTEDRHNNDEEKTRHEKADSNENQQKELKNGNERQQSKPAKVPRLCRRHKDFKYDVNQSSVTQLVQSTIKKYHMERGIFYQLLELKRYQIRSGRANEQVLVKRLADEYERSRVFLGMKPYPGLYKFKEFEKFLYDQLKALNSRRSFIIPEIKSYDDIDTLSGFLKKSRYKIFSEVPQPEMVCTCITQRCHHSACAYTSVPCSAYIADLRHHKHHRKKKECFFPRIDQPPKYENQRFTEQPATLELIQGNQKHVITLPQNYPQKSKRYYVTFTIKGVSSSKEEETMNNSKNLFKHRHAKSV